MLIFNFNFPFTKETQSNAYIDQYKKVVEELDEAGSCFEGTITEHVLEECIDLIHAAEGLLAVAVKEYMEQQCLDIKEDLNKTYSSVMFDAVVQQMFSKVLFKNYSRGYYPYASKFMLSDDNRMHTLLNSKKMEQWRDKLNEGIDYDAEEPTE